MDYERPEINKSAIKDAEIEMERLDVESGQVEIQADKYGTVKRGLKSRHIQFIAIGLFLASFVQGQCSFVVLIGGTIGTGLFVGTGGALVKGGPLSLLLGYVVVGTMLLAVIQCLAEMATYLPIPGGLTVYAKRYIGDHVAFALGFNYWFGASITVCAEVSAAALVIDYWNSPVHVAVWITIILFGILALNIFSVKGYGEGEFIFSTIKIVTIVGLLLLSVIIDLGGAPTHDRLGFRFWKPEHGGPTKEYLKEGASGRFLGFLSTFVYASFAYNGSEVIAVAACEAINPRRNIPRAVNRTFWRIIIFYIGGVLSVGCIVSSNDSGLINAISAGTPGAGSSPFVIGIQNAGIKALPSIINAVILTSAWSSGNAFLYTGSRNLYALAINGQAPRVFASCNRNGVPWVSVLATFAIGLLSYMNCSASASAAFGWFSNLNAVGSLFNWATLCYTYIRFRKGCQVQGITNLPFKALWGSWIGWYGLIMCSVIILIQGFAVFFGEFNGANFVAACIGLLIYFVPMAGWWLWKRSGLVPYAEMDFVTGKAEIDAEELDYVEEVPKNIWEKIWFAIA
ncbi:hypothetical protein YB2330_001277 [Saitoella coloradoensis]